MNLELNAVKLRRAYQRGVMDKAAVEAIMRKCGVKNLEAGWTLVNGHTSLGGDAVFKALAALVSFDEVSGYGIYASGGYLYAYDGKGIYRRKAASGAARGFYDKKGRLITASGEDFERRLSLCESVFAAEPLCGVAVDGRDFVENLTMASAIYDRGEKPRRLAIDFHGGALSLAAFSEGYDDLAVVEFDGCYLPEASGCFVTSAAALKGIRARDDLIVGFRLIKGRLVFYIESADGLSCALADMAAFYKFKASAYEEAFSRAYKAVSIRASVEAAEPPPERKAPEKAERPRKARPRKTAVRNSRRLVLLAFADIRRRRETAASYWQRLAQ